MSHDHHTNTLPVEVHFKDKHEEVFSWTGLTVCLVPDKSICERCPD